MSAENKTEWVIMSITLQEEWTGRIKQNCLSYQNNTKYKM